MKIERIRITNFRSIKDEEIRVTPLLALIGANNAGKSNILKAINLVLGERFPMPHSITRKDFYNEDPSNNINIEIFFDSCFISYNCECDAVIFRTTYNSENGNWETELRAKEKDKDEWQNWRMNGDARNQIATIYIPAARDFTKHLEGSSEWGLFGKVKGQFNYLFPKDRKSELENKFKDIKSLLMEAEEFKKFEEVFKGAFAEHILSSQNGVDLDISPFDPKHYYKHLEIIPNEYDIIKNLDQLGDGTKNLVLIALFRAYAEVFGKSTIFLIEEPEIYLHPQGRADLLNVFKSLAEKGSQVVYTTHSPELVDVEYLSSIGVVKKRIKDGEYYTKVLQIKEDRFKDRWVEATGVKNATICSIKLFLKNLSDAETNKGFFAKKIVLVEGKSEKWALQTYAKKASSPIDLEKENIEIISVSGKNNIDKFYLLFTELEYPIYVIFDWDMKTDDGSNANQRIMRLLGCTSEEFPEPTYKDTFAIFKDDFETELRENIDNYNELETEGRDLYGLNKKRGKEIVARYVASKTEPPEFIKTILNRIKEIRLE